MTKFAALIICVANVLGGALEWPEFRGPTGQGTSAATNVPVQWSATSNVVWRVEIPSGWSSPVVSGERIYLTAVDGLSLKTICLDEASGKMVWNTEVIHIGALGDKHQKNSGASPTPIVRGGKIYVHFGHLGTGALDLSGRVLWTQTEIKYSPVHGNGGSPELVDDALIFSCDGASDPFLIALDAATGKIRWKTPRNSPAQRKFSFSTPLLIQNDGAAQLISPSSGFVGAYNPKTGAELWRVRYGEGYSVVPRPVFANGLLFLSSGFDRPIVYAINPVGARGDATETAVAWSQARGAPNTPSLIAAGDEVYSVSDSGIATCFDAKTGKINWSERLGGNFSASPIFAEGRLYFLSEEGVTSVVRAGKTFELLAKNNLADRALASPAAMDNALILRSAGFLWRIGR